MNSDKKQELTRFLRFAVVGSIGAAVDFGVFNLLSSVAHVSAVPSSIVSFILAVCSNFTLNRYWTYPDSRSKPFGHQLVQFGVVSIIGLLIRTPLFAFLEKHLITFFAGILPAGSISPVFAGHNASLAIAIIVVMMWNFFANRLWTYNDVNSSGAVIQS